jgi:crotonobetainyl-CoA:carnitine CoA-transferase CaiB-like acyl-CoA transferase
MMTVEALAGMRVLDFTTGVAGPYATKLLADHGASVLKVEPPNGDSARRQGPFAGDEPHVEGSARFLSLNTNKRSMTLNLDTEEARGIVRRLVPEQDVIVEDFEPGFLRERGLGYEDLETLRPGIILVSLTPWGQFGPYVEYKQSDLIAQAMSGPMLWTGNAEREPLKLAGAVSHYHAGAMTALAATIAHYRQELTDEGEHVDISIYETQASSRDRVQPHITNYSYNGSEPGRRRAGVSLATGVRPCADGYVNIAGGTSERIPRFLRMIGREDLLGDERLAALPAPLAAELVEDIETSYLEWLMQRTKRQVVEEAQRARVMAAAINTPEDLVSDPHYRARGVWETIDHPHTGPVEYPGRPFIFSETPRAPARRAPLLGEHTAEELTRLGYHDADLSRLRELSVI